MVIDNPEVEESLFPHAGEIMQDPSLCLSVYAHGRMNSWVYYRPTRIDQNTIVMRDLDCGMVRTPVWWTPEYWQERLKDGIWRHVGNWEFVRADDPAADSIAWCHRDPNSAGREMYRLQQELERYLN